MKRFLLTLVCTLLVDVVAAADPHEAEIAAAFKDWKTVRFRFIEDEGDYALDWFVLLQRLDANRVAVSCKTVPVKPLEPQPPTELGVVSDAQAQRFIDRALAIYKRALPEGSEFLRFQSLPESEQKAFARKHPYGIESRWLSMTVVGATRTHELYHICDPGSAVAAEFEEFLRRPKLDGQ
jgi:hypothetical protein